MGMPLTYFKLAIARKFSRDANLSWINEESCSTARLTWIEIVTNHLLGVGRNIILTTDLWLWVDTRRKCRLYLTTSAMGADPLKKTTLLSTFFVNAYLLRGADIGYLALQPLSA